VNSPENIRTHMKVVGADDQPGGKHHYIPTEQQWHNQ